MTSLHCLNQIIAVAQSLVHETLLLNDSKYLASHKASLLTSSSSTSKPTLELVKFNEGDLVEVQARTWAGINKPGGAARIISFSAEEGSYEVKYVLTGAREKGILSVYMTSLNIEALPTNRRKPRGTIIIITLSDKIKYIYPHDLYLFLLQVLRIQIKSSPTLY